MPNFGVPNFGVLNLGVPKFEFWPNMGVPKRGKRRAGEEVECERRAGEGEAAAVEEERGRRAGE